MTLTATRTATRRTLSGKRVPADRPRLTWQDLVRPAVAPQAAPVIPQTPVTFRELLDGQSFRFETDPYGSQGTVYRRRNRQGWYESVGGGARFRTAVDATVVPAIHA